MSINNKNKRKSTSPSKNEQLPYKIKTNTCQSIIQNTFSINQLINYANPSLHCLKDSCTISIIRGHHQLTYHEDAFTKLHLMESRKPHLDIKQNSRAHLAAVDFKETGKHWQVVFLVLGVKQPENITSWKVFSQKMPRALQSSNYQNGKGRT